MVIISTISDDGILMEQYLVREKEGKELFDDILRKYKSSGFKVCGGSDLYGKYGPTLLQNDVMKVRVYTREREVI